MADRSLPARTPTDSDIQPVGDPIMYGTLHVVSTTAIESIDLAGWARRYVAAVLAVETAVDGSQAA